MNTAQLRLARYDTGMLGGRLKWTGAEQRTEEFRRQSSRVGWLLWTPLCVLMLIALWAGVVLQFFFFRVHPPEPFRWLMLAFAAVTTFNGIRMWKARH